jgi:hypothetical protein
MWKTNSLNSTPLNEVYYSIDGVARRVGESSFASAIERRVPFSRPRAKSIMTYSQSNLKIKAHGGPTSSAWNVRNQIVERFLPQTNKFRILILHANSNSSEKG